jgi:hypothetical protein
VGDSNRVSFLGCAGVTPGLDVAMKIVRWFFRNFVLPAALPLVRVGTYAATLAAPQGQLRSTRFKRENNGIYIALTFA